MVTKFATGIVLFEDFEILDVFGPIEMFGMHPERFDVRLVAEQRGEVASAQGPRSVTDDTFDDGIRYDILLVPGGRGTRREVDNTVILDWLKEQSTSAAYITSVCTGSAVLAKAGILDGVRATSNKMNYDWVVSQGPKVEWVYEARWVEDGNIFTSSGVSAGMDMSLALIERIIGSKAADDAALRRVRSGRSVGTRERTSPLAAPVYGAMIQTPAPYSAANPSVNWSRARRA